MIIAHVNPITSQIQSLEDHAKGVATLAAKFAERFGMKEYGEIMGLLHDKGKERHTFQSYIRKECGIDDGEYPLYRGEDKQHAFIGTALLQNNPMIAMIGFQIMGHHTGLPDYTDFYRKLKMDVPSEISPISLITPSPLNIAIKYKDRPKEFCKHFHHLVRVLFSCLVDADFLDTERFMQPEGYSLRKKAYSLEPLLEKLDNYIEALEASAPDTAINAIRRKIRQRCIEYSKEPTGFYSLNVPTGTGKTLSSISWGLRHAILHGKKRVIFAIPYTSIVAQTAQTLKDIFGEENVLEHHSNVSNEDHDSGDSQKHVATRLATENWDYPIIVTTNVQLFQSMMSNRVSKCRKLHNLADSVLILDEVQMLPLQHLQPIIDALKAYNSLFDMSVLLCTASMPALDKNIEGNPKLTGIGDIIKIAPDDWNLHNLTKRCDISVIKEPLTPEQLAADMEKHSRVLCIVNTRAQAKAVYEALHNEGKTMHLSRMMCPAHIKKNISKIKAALAQPDDSPLRVVATQLIEAGVDIDFPVVFRQEAGLDSVLQAAGRCNREGRLNEATTYMFKFEKKPFGDIGRACDALYATFGYFESDDYDFHSPDSMREYFIERYRLCHTFDKSDIKTKLENINELMFETAANDFKMIDDDTVTVIVNYKDSEDLMNDWRKAPSYGLKKKLLQYGVNLCQRDFDTLLKFRAVEDVNGLYYIPLNKFYSEECGLVIENKWLEESLIL